MHPISYAVAIIIFVGIKSCTCDVLVYTQSTNQVKFNGSLSLLRALSRLNEFKQSLIWNHSQIIEEFQSLAARFGPSLPPNGLRVLAVAAHPVDGCSPIEEAPKSNFSFQGITPKFAAVIVRGTCSFAGNHYDEKKNCVQPFLTVKHLRR